MSIITKRVTMTETAWAMVKEVLYDSYNECVTFGGEEHCHLDISDAITALAEAETTAVTETYSEDQWLTAAQREGRDV